MMKFISGVTFAVLLSGTTAVHAQVNAADSVMTHAKGNKLSLGGYGEPLSILVMILEKVGL